MKSNRGLRGVRGVRGVGWIVILLCMGLYTAGSVGAQNHDPAKPTPTEHPSPLQDVAGHAAGQGILAVVNGTPVTQAQLREESRLLHAAVALDPLWEVNALVDVTDKDIVENLIERELILQQAQANEIRIRSRWVDEALDELKVNFGKAASFDRYLSHSGMDESHLRERLLSGLMIQRLLFDQVTRGVRVSEAELWAFFNQHSEVFIRPSQVRAFHILIATPDESMRGQALLEIETIELQLARGADFTRLAFEHSDCPSKSKGGDLSYFTYDQVIPIFGDMAFALRPGQISNVVSTRLGYHLIKVIDRKPPSRYAFKDVRDRIEHTLRLNKENRAIHTYLAALKNESEIVRYPLLP